MNPLALLPPRIRLWVYLALVIASLVVAAYQAADGDWTAFASYLLGSLGFGTAATHTPRKGRATPGSKRHVQVHLELNDDGFSEAMKRAREAVVRLERRPDREPVDPTDLDTPDE